MQNAAREGDAISHGGSIVSGSGDVTINNQPAAMMSASTADCAQHGDSSVATGSGSVFINGFSAARLGDETGCGASITSGSDDVFIG